MKKTILIGFIALFIALPSSTEAYFGGLTSFLNGVKPSCHVYTNPEILDEGADLELHWTSKNATWAVLDTVGTVPVNGSRFLGKVGETKSYTITVGNNFGKTSCSATVHVRKISPDADSKELKCTLGVYPRNYIYGSTQKVALHWKVENAEYAFINNGIGYVRETEGSVLVSPSKTTTYTMQVNKGTSQRAFCSTTLTVTAGAGNNYVQNYTQPNTNTNYYGSSQYQYGYNGNSYVSLRYAPYTGAEDTAYVLLMIVLAIASFAVVYRYGKVILA